MIEHSDPYNHSLFPIKIQSVFPTSQYCSDMRREGECDQGHHWALKEKKHSDCMIPASEYICGALAQLCELPTMEFGIAMMPDGDLVFASRWIDGQLELYRAEQLLLNLAEPYASDLVDIYLFDLFVHNPDRHIGNYFFKNERGRPRVRAFDHSRALLYEGWPLPPVPMGRGTSTMTNARLLRIEEQALDHDCDQILNRLGLLTTEQIAQILGNIPIDWLDESRKSDIVETWEPQKNQRVADIRSHLAAIGQQ